MLYETLPLTRIPKSRLGETLVRHFLDRLEGDPADDALPMLLRSGATDDAAAERMRMIFRTQLTPAVRSVVADSAAASRRAGLIATQMLGLALCRHILRLPLVVALSRDAIAANIGPTIQRYLTALSTARQPGSASPGRDRNLQADAWPPPRKMSLI